MAYTINKTDGSIVATVPDGQVDQGSTDLTLIGKNFSGFGDYLNENFVKLLENFAGQTEPSQPLTGQLWYDSTENKIKVYTGSEWRSVGTSAMASTRPLDVSTGDFWFSTTDSQLFFYDGSRDYLIGPVYSASQNFSGFKVETVEDVNRTSRVVTGVYNAGRLIGYYSTVDFELRQTITGFDTVDENLNPIPRTAVGSGFNPANYDFKWQGRSDNSDSLGGIDATFYVRKDLSNVLTQNLTVQTNDGIFFGTGPQGQLAIENGTDVSLRNTALNGKITLRATKAGNLLNYIVITPDTAGTDSVDILPGNPDSTTRIGGSLEITGDLTVYGNQVNVDVSTLRVEDINIELGRSTSGSVTDEQAYNGGIVLKGTTDHYIIWNEAGTATTADQDWDFSENIDIPADRGYKIGGVPVLQTNGSEIELTTAVTSAPGLTSFGSQISITADNITINDNVISNNGRNTDYVDGDPPHPTDIIIEPLGNVEFIGSPKLIGIQTSGEALIDQTQEGATYLTANDPDQLSEATSKKYVTNLVRTRSIPLTLDITGSMPGDVWGTQSESTLSDNEIIAIVTQICPIDEYENGTKVRISTSRYYQEDDHETSFTITTTPLYDVMGAETPGGAQAQYGVVREIPGTVTIPARASSRLYVRRGYMSLILNDTGSGLAWQVHEALVEDDSQYDLGNSDFGTRL